ncbi:MAG: tRNA (adenosine(37)-N6)-threonylcarbamoyltransferase complex dimerization subunit type 1 TsaB [Eubacteriales bacterium]|nr:tRNA (adenosine(37)-N6)-threonylcarbamoyltransferase complex dimerization subunit type 1 TsaB [Eubacteriales bacterium]
MNIVAIDTSGPAASCAVLIDGEIVQSIAMNRGLTHSETIMPALDACMSAARLSCDQVDCFATVAGPGSFTGVRIGVCAVKGLAHAWNRPCARIDALEALAMNFAGFDGLACPILDARRGQVYCAAFDMKDGMPVRVLEDAAIDLTEFLASLPKDRRLVFLGDGLRVHAARIRETLTEALIAPANLRQLRADAACLLAEARPEEWMEARKLTPIYLRLPQAERERNQRLAAEAQK